MDIVKCTKTISSTFLRRHNPVQVQRVRNIIPSQSKKDSPSGVSYVINVIISEKKENATMILLEATVRLT